MPRENKIIMYKPLKKYALYYIIIYYKYINIFDSKFKKIYVKALYITICKKCVGSKITRGEHRIIARMIIKLKKRASICSFGIDYFYVQFYRFS